MYSFLRRSPIGRLVMRSAWRQVTNVCAVGFPVAGPGWEKNSTFSAQFPGLLVLAGPNVIYKKRGTAIIEGAGKTGHRYRWTIDSLVSANVLLKKPGISDSIQAMDIMDSRLTGVCLGHHVILARTREKTLFVMCCCAAFLQ